MRFELVFVMLLAAALNADPPAKTFVFLAGSEPERISGEALLGESRGALELTRSTPSYDIESMRTFTRQYPSVIMTTRRDGDTRSNAKMARTQNKTAHQSGLKRIHRGDYR